MNTQPVPTLPLLPAGSQQASGRFKPIDPVRILRQHVKLLSVVAVIGVVLGLATWFILLKTMPQYASYAQLRVSEGVVDVQKVRTGDMFSTTVAAMESYIKSEVYKIQSEDILIAALNDPTVRDSQWFATYKTEDGQPDVFKAREDLLDNNLSVYMIRGTQLISLEVITSYKSDCQKIAQAIVNVYLARVKRDTDNQVGSRRRSLVTELNRVESVISNLTTQIEQYTREHELTSLEARLEEAAIQMQMLVDQRGKKDFELTEYQKSYDALLAKQEAGGDAGASEIAQASQDEGIKLRDERLRTLREQREVSLHDFGEGHRIVQQIDRNIAATEAERERELERLVREGQQAMLGGLKQQIESITEQIAEYEDQILQEQKKLVDLHLYQTKYANLQSQLADATESRKRIQESLSEVRQVEDMDEARPVQLQSNPTLPELAFPKIEMIVPLVTMGLLMMTGSVIFLRELMDQSIKSPADIKLLKEAELIGILPHADEDPSGPSAVERVVEKYPTGLLAEAYRQVRTTILGKMDRRGYKTLLIASAQPDAGTSSVVNNLAASLAFNGRKVAVVDTNFRRPAQHTFVDAQNDRGLVDILLYGASLDDMILTLHDPDIAVLPTGRAGDAPPELLESARFRSLLGELETRFDIVLVDAPPALLSSECQLLARHVDAIATVVRAGRDKRGMIDRMAGQFVGQRADILGIILNGVQSNVGGYFRSSFRDFYRYRENGEGTNGKTNGHGSRRSVDVPETVEKE